MTRTVITPTALTAPGWGCRHHVSRVNLKLVHRGLLVVVKEYGCEGRPTARISTFKISQANHAATVCYVVLCRLPSQVAGEVITRGLVSIYSHFITHRAYHIGAPYY